METEVPEKKIGTLYMAATTLGDLRDIPIRALELLRTVPFLVFEEDKRARQFCNAAGMKRTWMNYTEQKEPFTLEELKRELLEGNDALYMSDQGTPGLSDPGRDLVGVAFAIGAPVRTIPGPSSLAATIAVCPIDCRSFQFAGFPPRNQNEREQFMRDHFNHPWPIAMFDTPYRMHSFFDSVSRVLKGSNRKVFVAVDISGEHEDFWYDTADAILKKAEALPEKRNFVAIIEGTGGTLNKRTTQKFSKGGSKPYVKGKGGSFSKGKPYKPKKRY